MKVTCEYCGSYVEANENKTCPHCNGSLSGAIRAEEARLRTEETERSQAEAEERSQAQKAAKAQQVARSVAGVAGALLGAGMRRPAPPRPPHQDMHAESRRQRPGYPPARHDPNGRRPPMPEGGPRHHPR